MFVLVVSFCLHELCLTPRYEEDWAIPAVIKQFYEQCNTDNSFSGICGNIINVTGPKKSDFIVIEVKK